MRVSSVARPTISPAPSPAWPAAAAKRSLLIPPLLPEAWLRAGLRLRSRSCA